MPSSVRRVMTNRRRVKWVGSTCEELWVGSFDLGEGKDVDLDDLDEHVSVLDEV
jgi:hypothetical protein